MIEEIKNRIEGLRKLMDKQEMSAYIVPSSDPHISEYPAARWKSREWLSGFTGSAGTIVVTADKAGLWTDSRYFLQAEEQLAGTGIELYKLAQTGTPSIVEFLSAELNAGETVGFDGQTYSAAEARSLKHILKKTKGLSINSSVDLIDALWDKRPPIPTNPLFEIPTELSGASVSEKISEINNSLFNAGADCTVLSALDEIAWTFNIRGTDVDYNPVTIAYAFISEKESVLFIQPQKLTDEIATGLKREGVILADYSMICKYLSNIPKEYSVFVDAAKTNAALFDAIPSDCTIIEGVSIVAHLKSIKNETEIKGFRNAMIKDGVALTRFFIWLENKMAESNVVTELSASKKLSTLRSEQNQYIMDSFSTIAGYADHGAIVHYNATEESDAILKPESLFLLDSGGQYLDGTTDITRTIALGKPSDQMKKDFTRVLKGMISIAKCKFPEGTRGSQIDILARKALWDAGLNYLHGTGHGIGHCLNVHEGPQSIRAEENPVPLKVGMVTSDEPGIYRSGEYGIRIENLVLVEEDSITEYGRFLTFETLSLCYIDTTLVVSSMLSLRESNWINNYHQMVYDSLSPHLTDEENIWLKSKTAEI